MVEHETKKRHEIWSLRNQSMSNYDQDVRKNWRGEKERKEGKPVYVLYGMADT